MAVGDSEDPAGVKAMIDENINEWSSHNGRRARQGPHATASANISNSHHGLEKLGASLDWSSHNGRRKEPVKKDDSRKQVMMTLGEEDSEEASPAKSKALTPMNIGIKL